MRYEYKKFNLYFIYFIFWINSSFLNCRKLINKFIILEAGIKSGPFRVWVKTQNYPGLAMSRSIGDLCAGKIGVTCDPGKMNF